MTSVDDDFKTLRRYSRQEAAEILQLKDSILRTLVSKRAVPHQRTGKPGKWQRGVWFTYDDILQIGRMLPDRLSGRQANTRAEVPVTATEPTEGEHPEGPDAVIARAITVDISEDELARFRSLASLPRR
ncbi:hypothetical protein [Nocardioides sp. P5_E3]